MARRRAAPHSVDRSSPQRQRTFEQLRDAAQLQQLGLSPRRLKRMLAQLHTRFSSDHAQMIRSLRREGRRLVARLPDGRLVEPSGQLVFEFDEAYERAVVLPWPIVDAEEDPLDRAVDLEEAGQFAAAADLYRQIVRDHPADAQAWYNLGNVLYQLDDLTGSRQAYQCSLALAYENASAWNNLGVMLSELGELREARRCWRRALLIDPANREAEENLASTALPFAANQLGF